MKSCSFSVARWGKKRRRTQEIELPVPLAAPPSSEHPQHPESSLRPWLSLLPFEDRQAQYMKKFRGDYVVERSLVRDKFAGIGIISAFRAFGWEGILETRSMYYPQACRDFIAGIKSHGYESLTSEYRGAEVTFTSADIAAIARIDPAGPYECRWSTLDRSAAGFYSRVADLTGLSVTEVTDRMRARKGDLPRSLLTLLARSFHKISETNLNPRTGNVASVGDHEVFLIHALITGSPKYSLAYIILESWWEALEDPKKRVIPFCSILSQLLERKGLIAPYTYDDYVTGTERADRLVIIGDEGASISRTTLHDISFNNVAHTLSSRSLLDLQPCVSTVSLMTPEELESEMTSLVLQKDAQGPSDPASNPLRTCMSSGEYHQLMPANLDLGARLEGQVGSLGVQMTLLHLHEFMTALEGRGNLSFQPQYPGDTSILSHSFQPAGTWPVPLRRLIRDPSGPVDDTLLPDLNENSLGCSDNGDSDDESSEASSGGCSLEGFRAKFDVEKGKEMQITGTSVPVNNVRSSSTVEGSQSDCVNPTTEHGPPVANAGTSMEIFIDKELVEGGDSETEGVWHGHVVGVEAREFLQAVECHYPNTFQGVQTRSNAIWLTILKEFCLVIKGLMETSVAELEEDQLNSLWEALHEFERFGFDLSWAQDRLKLVEDLKFGNSPLVQELVALDESLKPLTERLVQQREELKQLLDALREARLEYENAVTARNDKALEVSKKLGADYDCVLKGRLGSGILSGY